MRLKQTRLSFVLMLILLLVLILVAGCGNGAAVSDSGEEPAELVELTLEELAAFDGLDGRPAYVAVDGIVYDMSNSRSWPGGNHNGFQAGQDLTEAIRNDSPHGVGNLSRVPEIGRIVD